MPAVEEVQKSAAEQSPATEKPVKVKKAKAAPKEKKAKTAKTTKTTKTASHPPYFEMIKEALLALKEKSGSSPYAIAKYMEEKHKAVLPANFRKTLGLQIKNSASKGKLIKIKASYKLSEPEKKNKATAAKPAAKKPAMAAAKKSRVTKTAAAGTKRKADAVKKVAAKKVSKKATPTKAKQPKSIKSPASKRARRSSAA